MSLAINMYQRKNIFAFESLADLKRFFSTEDVDIDAVVAEAKNGFKPRAGEEKLQNLQLIRKVEIMVLRLLKIG